MHRALGEALAAAYPAVQRLVGVEFFAATARAYHAQEDTRSATLTRHGAGFADFLAAFPPVAHLPYLADVARLERAWLEALHAADGPTVDAARVMARLDGAEQLTFAPHPAARLVASQYPVVTIWQANQPGSAPGAGREILDVPEAALVTRPDLSVIVTPVDHATMVFAGALFAQATLARAYAAAQSESAAFDIVGALAALLSSGSLSHIVGDAV